MSPLGEEIALLIRQTGPIGIDRYMSLCLGHPVHGYYRTRDPIGARGDFTTAPEISQMFGELIGLWVAAIRGMLDPAAQPRLVELGPGRGTLMADALRALGSVLPDAAIDLHLVETSPPLRAAQAAALSRHRPTWHEGLAGLPEGPVIAIANEFFDCLPVRQFARTERGWCERLVGLSAAGGLAFGLAPDPEPGIRAEAPPGALLTLPSAGLGVMRDLAARLTRAGGVLLLIDYGHVAPGFGDTLQALSRHRFADPLAEPGEADLTAHVDFAALAQAARGEGARVHGPVEQRDFLLDLGLLARAERLKRAASPAQGAAIEAAVARLTDPAEGGMGRLFKVMAVSGPGLAGVPGLPPP
ncbi:class I SAM-dependent methyltransferase [Methylobacterium segetis]|uniref:class I SAM-dependent methyltransferase n=1 Tax=Methylobacterium segetis TaxID=2488750 RepID=UPI001FDFB246|nr:SAM-dependent methyltransferase [Methylobacterium segetis]